MIDCNLIYASVANPSFFLRNWRHTCTVRGLTRHAPAKAHDIIIPCDCLEIISDRDVQPFCIHLRREPRTERVLHVTETVPSCPSAAACKWEAKNGICLRVAEVTVARGTIGSSKPMVYPANISSTVVLSTLAHGSIPT